MKIIEQNKNYSAMILTAMILLIVAVFFISPVFADSLDSLPKESPGIQLAYKISNNSPVYYWQHNYLDSDVVYFAVVSGSSNSLYFVTNRDISSSEYVYIYVNNNGIHAEVSTTLTNSSFPDLHYASSALGSDYSSVNCPVYSSLLDGLAAASDFFENGGSDDYGTDLLYSIPPGNVAFIECGSDFGGTITTQFVEASGLFSGNFSKTSQTWGYSDSIVSSGSFPISGHQLIPWIKDTRPQNLLGQSHYGLQTLASASGSGKYFVLYNPLYSFQMDQESNFEHNFPVTLNLISVKSITVVSLKGTLASGIESSWTYTSEPDGTIYEGTIDPDTYIPEFTDQNGNPSDPTYGGANYIPEAEQNFKGWLNSLLSRFMSIFEVGHNAIMTLISAGSAFFSSIGSLYSWLPSSVYSVLSAAIVLVISIGVIKVFL